MTNEELAVRAKNHEEWAVLDLWEAVKRFVRRKAKQYLQAADHNTRAEFDDLMQDGFLAMLDAVEVFDPDRGGGFLGVLLFMLRKRFAEEGGHRTSKRDALTCADSLDVPALPDDTEGDTKAEALPDPCSEYAFMLVEYEEFIKYTRHLLRAALASLPQLQRERIIQHYYQGIELDTMCAGEVSRQAVCDSLSRGLRYLRRGKYRRELLEAMHGFEDFRAVYKDDQHRLDLKAMAQSPKYGK